MLTSVDPPPLPLRQLSRMSGGGSTSSVGSDDIRILVHNVRVLACAAAATWRGVAGTDEACRYDVSVAKKRVCAWSCQPLAAAVVRATLALTSVVYVVRCMDWRGVMAW